MSTNRSNDRSSCLRSPRRRPVTAALWSAADLPPLSRRKTGHPCLRAFPAGGPPDDSPCSLCSGLRALCGKSFSALSTLAHFSQTPVSTLHLVQNEYINAYDTNTWRETIRTSHKQSADHKSPNPPSRAPEPSHNSRGDIGRTPAYEQERNSSLTGVPDGQRGYLSFSYFPVSL